MYPRLLHGLAFLFVLLAQVACERSTTRAAEEAQPVSAWLPIEVGDVPLDVQIVISQREQAKGLMNRESLDEDRGMLFPYREPRSMAFWMKDTLIPLDIGFFDGAGVLREIHRLYPRDTRGVRSRGNDLSYALEVNQGWFARHGVAPGARFDLELLRDALRARGAEPSEFGLPSE